MALSLLSLFRAASWALMRLALAMSLSSRAFELFDSVRLIGLTVLNHFKVLGDSITIIQETFSCTWKSTLDNKDTHATHFVLNIVHI
jgi:hypothetical protein